MYQEVKYSDGKKYYKAIELDWQTVEEILGHPHSGSPEDDAAIREAIRMNGAPEWAYNAEEGYVSENAYGLIGYPIIILYRADDYQKNMGSLIGFYTTKEEAEAALEHKSPVAQADGTFSQITEFEVPDKAMQGIDIAEHIENNERMLSFDIWGSGKIVNTYYYQ